MSHITKARSQSQHLLRILFAFQSSFWGLCVLIFVIRHQTYVWVTVVWAVTVSRDKSSALVLLWLFNIPVSHWPLVICESLILGLPLGELSQPFCKQRLTEPFVCVTVISLSLFSVWLVKAALVHIMLLTMAHMTVCKRKEPLKVTKLLNHAQAQLYGVI